MTVYNDYNFIGSDLRKIRESKGITRKEISEKMFITEETIRRIEKGENDPRLSTLIPICNYLDIDLREIINGNAFSYKNLLSLREEINNLLNNSSIEKASQLITNLNDIELKSSVYFERELYATKHYYSGLLSMLKNDKSSNPSDDFELALADMNAKFKIAKFKNYKYDQFSLRILLALASHEYRMGNNELYKDIMLEVRNYLSAGLENYFVISYNIATFYSRIGDYQESLNICNEAISNARFVKETSYLNMLYYVKGVNLVLLHQLSKARESFNYSITLTNIFSSEKLAASIMNQADELLLNYN